MILLEKKQKVCVCVCVVIFKTLDIKQYMAVYLVSRTSVTNHQTGWFKQENFIASCLEDEKFKMRVS